MKDKILKKISLKSPKEIKLSEKELIRRKRRPDKTVLKIVERYNDIQVAEKLLKAEKEELKKVINNEMQLRGIQELLIGDNRVLRTNYQQEQFNMFSFKVNNPDLYENYTYYKNITKITVR